MTADKKDWGKEVVAVDLTNEELTAAIKFLEFAAHTFEVMAQTAHAHEDAENLHHFQVRIAFARVFANKLANSLEIGDAKNRTFH